MDNSGSAFDAILSYFVAQFGMIWLGSIWFSNQVWASGSKVADPATNRTVRLTIRGDWTYVEPVQSHLLTGGNLGVFLCLLLLAVMLKRWIWKAKPPRFHLVPSAVAAVVAIIFWTGAAKFSGT